MECGRAIEKIDVIPSITNPNLRTTPGGDGSAAYPPLVVVSLQAMRDATIKNDLNTGVGRLDFSQLAADDTMLATVVAKTQSAYVLQIGNTLAELDILGAALEPGTQLRLRFIDTGQASAHIPMGIEQQNQSPQLSSLGRLLSQIVALPGNSELTTPLTTSPVAAHPEAAGEFLQALRQSISSSGLFYESHLKEWVNNQRPLDAIRREPQAKLAPASTNIEASVVQANGVDSLIPANVLPIVRHQLNALEAQIGCWRTEVWPGQFAELSIEQDDASPNSSASEPPPWCASLKLQLPHLGAVAIAISLNGERPEIKVKAAEPGAETSLTAARSNLLESLGAAGFAAGPVDVQHDGP